MDRLRRRGRSRRDRRRQWISSIRLRGGRVMGQRRGRTRSPSQRKMKMWAVGAMRMRGRPRRREDRLRARRHTGSGTATSPTTRCSRRAGALRGTPSARRRSQREAEAQASRLSASLDESRRIRRNHPNNGNQRRCQSDNNAKRAKLRKIRSKPQRALLRLRKTIQARFRGRSFHQR